MKLHHGIFQQVFNIAAENTGQLVEDVCLRLVNNNNRDGRFLSGRPGFNIFGIW